MQQADLLQEIGLCVPFRGWLWSSGFRPHPPRSPPHNLAEKWFPNRLSRGRIRVGDGGGGVGFLLGTLFFPWTLACTAVLLLFSLPFFRDSLVTPFLFFPGDIGSVDFVHDHRNLLRVLRGVVRLGLPFICLRNQGDLDPNGAGFFQYQGILYPRIVG